MGRMILALLVMVPALGGTEFRFGRAAVRITPTETTGGVKKVLDDLYVKAVVFERDGSAAAMAVCDLPVINRPIVESARNRIEKETGIPGGRIMISATHSHTGLTPGWAGPTAGWEGPLLRGKDLDGARRYTDFLSGAIAEAVKLAYSDLKPARVAAAIGREESLVFNRRFLMKDGAAQFNPGLQNPDIVRPLGPTDPDVSVMYVDALDGKPLATLVNYALHLDTIGGEVYSADYPYTLSKLLAAVKGAEMLTLFTIGTAGNINHLDVTRPGPQRGYEEAARIGTILAAAVLKTYPKLERLAPDGVRVTRETVDLPPVELKGGDLEKAHELASAESNGKRLSLLERVFMQRALFAEKQHGRPFEVEVQAIALGKDLAFVGLPGEVFVELGMAIKKGSPFRFTVVNELAYDWIRYVPNRKGFVEGAYEAINTRCGPGGGEMLVDAALRCLLRLHQDKE
jgi:neutral ceramidase